jgi:hypothetical protein
MEETAGREIVVGLLCVGERLALDDDESAAVSEKVTDCESDEHDDQAGVEQQVPSFAKVSALG